MTDEEKRFDRREEARLDDMYDAQCERCGEVNPAEIHTCTPKHEDIYGCAECGKQASEGWALYCVKCSEPVREWKGLTDEEIREFEIWLDDEEEKHGWNPPADIVKHIEAKLKEKNT